MIANASEERVTMKVTASKKIAKMLLDIGAVKLSVEKPFIWTSGIESPIYCDNRIINSIVNVRSEVITEFSNIILKNFLENEKKVDIIAGIATGGITYGALVADRLQLPFIYIRAERKTHGLMKVIEGDYAPGDRIVLIEDHISTGSSSLRAVDHARDEQLEVVGLLSIMTYNFNIAENEFKSKGVEHGSICDLDTILEVALSEGRLSQRDVQTILKFRANPKDPSWKN
jgi:orotate phosphoribosyltransferase